MYKTNFILLLYILWYHYFIYSIDARIMDHVRTLSSGSWATQKRDLPNATQNTLQCKMYNFQLSHSLSLHNKVTYSFLIHSFNHLYCWYFLIIEGNEMHYFSTSFWFLFTKMKLRNSASL